MSQCRMHEASLAVGEKARVINFSKPLWLGIVQIDWLLPMYNFRARYRLEAMGCCNKLCLIGIVPLGIGSVVTLSLIGVCFGLRAMDGWGIYCLIITHARMRPLSVNVMEQWVFQGVLWNFPDDCVVVILFYIWVWNRLLHHLCCWATFSNIWLSVGSIGVWVLLKIKVIDEGWTIFTDFIDLHKTHLFVAATIHRGTRWSTVRHQ